MLILSQTEEVFYNQCHQHLNRHMPSDIPTRQLRVQNLRELFHEIYVTFADMMYRKDLRLDHVFIKVYREWIFKI